MPRDFQLESELVGDEGEVLHAYQDSKKYWTIGVGQLIDVRKGGGISKAASRFMLAEAIEERRASLESWLEWFTDLDIVRQRVLLNVAFNVGVKGFFEYKKMLQAMSAKDYETAAVELLDSSAARDLPKRYLRLAERLRSGV